MNNSPKLQNSPAALGIEPDAFPLSQPGSPPDSASGPDTAAQAAPISLDAARSGEPARIAWLTAEGMLGQRLADMGFCPGARVEVVRNAPLGDPLQVDLDGVMVCIRRSEAAQVEVLPLAAAQAALRAELAKGERP